MKNMLFDLRSSNVPHVFFTTYIERYPVSPTVLPPPLPTGALRETQWV